jgi:hypothetical protein
MFVNGLRVRYAADECKLLVSAKYIGTTFGVPKVIFKKEPVIVTPPVSMNKSLSDHFGDFVEPLDPAFAL